MCHMAKPYGTYGVAVCALDEMNISQLFVEGEVNN